MSNKAKYKEILRQWFNAVWTTEKFDISEIEYVAEPDIVMQLLLNTNLKFLKAFKICCTG